MKINKNQKLELLTDASRGAIAHLLLEDKKIVACNGHALVAVHVETEEHDTDGLIPTDALIEARRLAGKGHPVALSANGNVTLANNATYDRPEDQYPDWHKVGPSLNKTPVITIGLNARTLYDMVKAFGAGNDNVTLTIYDELGPMFVKPGLCPGTDTDSDFGYFMPARVK